MQNDEWLWVVDRDDQPIGKVLRSAAYRDGRNDFRVVNAFVVNSEGKLWIPTRGSNKRIFPNALDVSVGGHVEYGESYELSFFRETIEEINLDLNLIKWKELGKLTPHEHGVSAFMKLYVIYSDETPNYNREDFSDAQWLTPEQALSLAETGAPAKGDYQVLLRYYISNHK